MGCLALRTGRELDPLLLALAEGGLLDTGSCIGIVLLDSGLDNGLDGSIHSLVLRDERRNSHCKITTVRPTEAIATAARHKHLRAPPLALERKRGGPCVGVSSQDAGGGSMSSGALGAGLTDEEVADRGLLSVGAAPLRGEGYIDLAEGDVEGPKEGGGHVIIADSRSDEGEHLLLDLHLRAELGAREARRSHDTRPVGLFWGGG